jgi:putative endonuclease
LKLNWSAIKRGNSAEQVALEYLQQQGYRLVKRNFHSRYGEIDLIVENEMMLLIVEVRFRSSSHFGSAAESVDARKQAKIIRCAEQFLQQYPPNKAIRLDVIAVTPGDQQAKIDWIQDAFRA